MSTHSDEVLPGTDGELRSMASELDELHHDVSLPAMMAGVDRMIDTMGAAVPRRSTSRRTFLLGAGAAVAGGAALVTVGSVAPSLASAALRHESSFKASFPPAGLTGDLAVAAVAASLENLAVFAYTAGLQAATAGKLGKVPPAVGTFATTARTQHVQHANAWNSVLKAHGKKAVTVVNPTLAPTVQSDFAKVTDIGGLAQLALTLETIAAETYQVETAQLKSTAAIALSASIEPVEMQHIAILYYVLGMYPGAQTAAGTPLAFSSTSQAA